MSGSVSGAQFNFVPHVSANIAGGGEDDAGTRPSGLADLMNKPSKSGMGVAGREFTGTRSLAPIARGAFSTQDNAIAFRHQGGLMSSGAKNIGTWLYRPED